MTSSLASWLACGLVFVGLGFLTMALLVFARRFDVYETVQVAGSGALWGTLCLLAGVVLVSEEATRLRGGLTILFLFATAPASAHALLWAARRAGHQARHQPKDLPDGQMAGLSANEKDGDW